MTLPRPRRSPVLLLLGAIFLFASNVLAAAAVLGIDFGTQNIKAVLVKPGVPFDIVLTKDSRRKETAAVAFKPFRGTRKEGQFPERSYGADAMALAARFPEDVYPNLKAVLGLRMWDQDVRKYQKRHPGLKIGGYPDRATVSFLSSSLPQGDDSPWMVEELLAMELAAIKHNAQLAAGEDSKVRAAVVTIPPYFTAAETRAIRTAAELAGIKVTHLISDGLAVGLHYATTRQFPNVDEGAKPELHMVLDMGAGSTTGTVMRFQSRTVKDVGKYNKTIQEVQVLGSGWDRQLGGNELNYVIVENMIRDFTMTQAAFDSKIDRDLVMLNGRTLARLKRDAERIRHVLSANQDAFVNFEALYGDLDFRYLLTRPDLNSMAEAHVDKLLEVFHAALKTAGIETRDLTSVILHGGATRTPFMQKALEQVMGSEDKVRTNVNADEAAAFGAAFKAAELSPSFRVKEIRTSEAASYAAGLAWMDKEDGKPRNHELWPAGSPLGVVAEHTFSELEDFSGSFYQKIDAVFTDVKKFSTKNLTATAAALKDKYPSCVDTKFRIGLRLRSEDVEMEIANAVVECEAEVPEKETLMDGVKNLLGFGKKDQQQQQQPLKSEDGTATHEGEGDVKGDDKKSSKPAESAATASSGDPEATEGVAKEVRKKKMIVSIPVEITTENAGYPDLTKAQWTKAKDRLKAYAASDRNRLKREEAINQLESYTYKVRDLLETEAFIAMSTEVEREFLSNMASEFSDWLYEEGEESEIQAFKANLGILEEVTNPILFRIKEAQERPELIQTLGESLERAGRVIGISRNQNILYEKWLAESGAQQDAAPSESPVPEQDNDFEGLEDDEDDKEKNKQKQEKNKKKNNNRKKSKDGEDEGSEGKGKPLKPAHTDQEINDFQALVLSTELWLSEQLAAQKALAPTDNPVLLTRDLHAKYQEFLTAHMTFSRKLMLKDKADKSKATKGGASDGPYADLEALLHKEDPFVKEDGTPMTEEEVQDLLRRAKEWAATQKEEQKKGGRKGSAEQEASSSSAKTGDAEEHQHDEL